MKVKVKSLSGIRLVATPTAAHQAPPSMGFSRQEYWSGLPLPSLPICHWAQPKREKKKFLRMGTVSNDLSRTQCI